MKNVTAQKIVTPGDRERAFAVIEAVYPLRFHTQVLGFERIGTHRYGELACASARIILILDIARAYQRLKKRENKVWKELGEGVRDVMEPRLIRTPA